MYTLLQHPGPPWRRHHRQQRLLRFLAAAVFFAVLFTPPTLARLPSIDRAATPAGHIAVLGADLEVYLEATAQADEDLARFARRLCGTAAAAGDIAHLNRSSELRVGLLYRVPFKLLRTEHQAEVIHALFPEDRIQGRFWEHRVENGGRRGIETLSRIARWLTGEGENAGILQEVNALPRKHLTAGQVVRIPTELLWPALKAEAGVALIDSGDPPLEYRYDGTGLHAIYRLRSGEAFETAVHRLTTQAGVENQAMVAEIASLNGVNDPLALTAGYEVKIPANRLKPDLRAPELWLPTPQTQQRPVGAVGFSHLSTRDYLLGLGLAAPHNAESLGDLLGEGSPLPSPDSAIPFEPGGGRSRKTPKLRPSDRFPELDILPYSLRVDGKRLRDTEILIHRERGILLLPFSPIAEALGHQFRLDSGGKRLLVERAPDGASLSLNLATGLVIANRLAAGVAPEIRHAELDPLFLPVAATEAMTGGHVRRDDDRREIRVELDDRLKPVFGFDLIVEGEPLLLVTPEPRAVGPVLLLPLEPIAEALGDEVLFDPSRQTVSVLRAQDNATIVLELGTGVVRVNDWAAGVVPYMPYADVEDLLLPQAAVEALTGTNARVEAGTRRISLTLDPQLQNLLPPRGTVYAEAAEEGLLAERMDLRLGNDIPNEIRLRGRYGKIGFQMRYETPGFPEGGALDPLWAEIQFETLGGTRGLLGDYNASYRELRGVDISRIRGLAFRHQGEAGEFRFALGRPQRGSRLLTEDLTVPTFDDWAFGGRYYAAGGRWEAGLSALDSDGQRKVVGSFLHRWEAPEGRWASLRSHQELDLGFFEAEGLDSDLDLRARWSAHLRPTRTLALAAQARYVGLEFNRTRPRFEDELRPPLDQRDPEVLPPDDADRFESRLQLTWQPDPRIALGARWQLREDAFLEGAEESAGRANSWGLNLTTQPWRQGPRLRVDYGHTNPSGSFGDEEEQQVRIDLTQNLGRFRLFARHEEDQDGRVERSLTSLSLRMNPLTISLPQGATLLFAPGIRAFKSDHVERSDVDLRTELRSGNLFGRRFELAVGYVRSIGLDTTMDSQDSSRFQETSRDQETLHATARYLLYKGVHLEASYINDLTRDEDRLLVRLRAGIDFNPERRYRLPNQGTGVLTGFAFLDKNQDGLHQPGEPPLPGLAVRILGRRLSLKTDRLGRFTIQNLRAGPYELAIDLENLPLGLLPYDEHLPRLTVGDSQLTHIEIPMVLSGQIRGFLYVDQNSNGAREPSEPGLEGIKLLLHPGDQATYTTTFGQFAFDRLRAGMYRIELEEGFLPEGMTLPEIEILEISPEVELLRKVEIGLLKVLPGEKRRTAVASPRPR